MKYLVMSDPWIKLLDSRISELHPKSKKLRRLIEQDDEIFVTGIIIQEVIHKLEGQEQRKKVLKLMDSMGYIEFDKEDYIRAAVLSGNDLTKNLHQIIADRLSMKIID